MASREHPAVTDMIGLDPDHSMIRRIRLWHSSTTPRGDTPLGVVLPPS